MPHNQTLLCEGHGLLVIPNRTIMTAFTALTEFFKYYVHRKSQRVSLMVGNLPERGAELMPGNAVVVPLEYPTFRENHSRTRVVKCDISCRKTKSLKGAVCGILLPGNEVTGPERRGL